MISQRQRVGYTWKPMRAIASHFHHCLPTFLDAGWCWGPWWGVSWLPASSHSRTLSRLWLTSHTCQETEFHFSCQLGKKTLCGFPHLLVGVVMACRHRRALHSCLILNSKHEFTCGLGLKGNSNIMSSRLLFQKMQTCTQPPFRVRGELVPEFQIYRGFFIWNALIVA